MGTMLRTLWTAPPDTIKFVDSGELSLFYSFPLFVRRV
jgi:hypothetical protein